MIQRRMSVAEISFSAHVDFSQNAEFIELVKAPHVVSYAYFSCDLLPDLISYPGLGSWATDRYGKPESSDDG